MTKELQLWEDKKGTQSRADECVLVVDCEGTVFEELMDDMRVDMNLVAIIEFEDIDLLSWPTNRPLYCC